MDLLKPLKRLILRSSSESPEIRLKQAVAEGVRRATEAIRSNYDDQTRRGQPSERENLPYHNLSHTRSVVDYTVRILKAIRAADSTAVSDSDIALGELAAAFHDVVQKTNSIESGEGTRKKVMRTRVPGESEQLSIVEMQAYVAGANREAQNKGHGVIFSDDDIAACEHAIRATVPTFDTDLGTVIQNNLTSRSSIIAHAVALADLGTPGLAGGPMFRGDGTALFREMNIDVGDEIRTTTIAEIGEERLDFFADRAREWMKSQVRFAEGRKARFEKEIEFLSDAARSAVRELFSHFDHAIDSAREFVRTLEIVSSANVLRHMGYHLKE